MRVSTCLIAIAIAAVSVWAADEITVSASLRVNNGDLAVQKDSGGSRYTQTTKGHVGGVQIIGTNACEALPLTDLTAAGWCYMRNLDTNNPVEVGVVDVNTNFLPLLKVKATEFALFRLVPGVTPYALATNANVRLDFEILDD
jgi:hypothetical protein